MVTATAAGTAAREVEALSATRATRARLEAHRRAGRLRDTVRVDGTDGVRAAVDGRDVVVMCSNDYLGLRLHPRVVQAARRALAEHGAGTGSSRLIAGTSVLHERLEQRLAERFGAEAALVLSSGYHANLAVLTTVCGEGDIVVSDALNHASIVDGCRLSRARIRVVPHGDAAAAERALTEGAGRGARWLVAEGLFSMDGDRIDLAAYARVARAAGGALIVDEAHSIGVVGPEGRGACADPELGDAVALRVGTLGKALGSHGAFVLCDAATRRLLVTGARSFLYTTALPPASAAAALAALEVMDAEPWRREALWRRAEQLWRGLDDLGLVTAPAPSPITPVVAGTERAAVALADHLLSRGYFSRAIRPPTVPEGTCRVRLTVAAGHEQAHIQGLLEAIAEAADTLDLPRADAPPIQENPR